MAAIIWAVFVGRLAVARHDNLQTNAFDLGYVSQALWYDAHGEPFRFTTVQGVSAQLEGVDPTKLRHPHWLLAFHVEPALLLLAPLYRLWADPRLLLWLQAVVLAAGALPAAWLARRLLASDLAAVVFGVAYLLAPGLEGAALSDFHMVAIGAALLMTALWLLETGRYRWALACFALTALCREDAAVAVACVGLVVLAEAWQRPPWRVSSIPTEGHNGSERLAGQRRHAFFFSRNASQSAGLLSGGWRLGRVRVSLAGAISGGRWRLSLAALDPRHKLALLLALAGGVWALACVGLVEPVFSGGASAFVGRYSWLLDAARHGNLAALLGWLAAPDVRAYVGLQLLTGGLLALLAPLQLLAAVPLLAINTLSSFDWMRSGGGHYSALLAPLLLWAGMHGVRRLTASRRDGLWWRVFRLQPAPILSAQLRGCGAVVSTYRAGGAARGSGTGLPLAPSHAFGPSDSCSVEDFPGPSSSCLAEDSPGPSGSCPAEDSPGPSDSCSVEDFAGPSSSRAAEASPDPSGSCATEASPGPSSSRAAEASPGPSSSRAAEASPGPSGSRPAEDSPGPSGSCLAEDCPGRYGAGNPEGLREEASRCASSGTQVRPLTALALAGSNSGRPNGRSIVTAGGSRLRSHAFWRRSSGALLAEAGDPRAATFRWGRQLGRRRRGSTPVASGRLVVPLLVVLVSTAAAQAWIGVSPLHPGFSWPKADPRAPAALAALARIPKDAPVSATSALYPHVSARRDAYWFPAAGNAPWLALDVAGVTHPLSPVAARATIIRLLEQPGSQVLNASDGVLVVHSQPQAPREGLLSDDPDERTLGSVLSHDPKALPDSFYRFARVEGGLPPSATASGPVRFGSDLQLAGYELRQWPQVGLQGGAATLVTYWRATAAIPTDLRFALATTRTSDGALSGFREDAAAAPLWYPTSGWQPGELIRLEMPVEQLRGVQALGVAVLDGQRRLPVSGAPAEWDGQTIAQVVRLG